jgi:hypothetical protein
MTGVRDRWKTSVHDRLQDTAADAASLAISFLLA